MKKVSLIALLGWVICPPLAAQVHKDYPIRPVSFTQVEVTDSFWAPKLAVNERVTIPYTLAQCRRTGRIDNFLRAAGRIPVDTVTAYPFDDTDLYKLIEGASYSLQTKKNPALAGTLDSLIEIIGAAQEPDGYLYTFRTMKAPKPHEWIGARRWQNEEDLSHELYDAGHLYEAAVAHFQATGKRNFLNIALRNADLLVATFGKGKEEKFPGHQIVETGLVKLYRVTGNRRYLDLAKYFLDLRGRPGHLNQEYSQSLVKVTDQHTAVGHAVRGGYMYSAMADIAALTADPPYLAAVDYIWKDVVDKKMYITGGLGSTNNGEAFGPPYDLPNMSAYAETCAAIASVYWNNRMFLLHGEAKYVDVLERILYNGLLSGVSLSGDRFFYPNPLASLGQHERSAWFNCACCISNMTRFLPSMPGYIYAQNDNNLYINLFVGSRSSVHLPAADLVVEQNTRYPWSGKDEITVIPNRPGNFSLHIRIPGWSEAKPVPGDLYREPLAAANPFVLLLNGKSVPYAKEKGYAVIRRTWRKGDKVLLDLPMDVEKVTAKDSVTADQGRFALQRGPLVYCLEGADNTDSSVINIFLDRSAVVNAVFRPDVLNGIVELQANGIAVKRQPDSDRLLLTRRPVTAIPYYSWANRGPGEMEVWIPFDSSGARPTPNPTIASGSRVSGSVTNPRMLRMLNDQYDPAGAKDADPGYLHWWPRKNSTEWVEYDFDSLHTVSASGVYWFDDGPSGGCRLPAAWKLYYRRDDHWLPVNNPTPYTITKDRYDRIRFEPVATTALRLEVTLPKDFSAGIYEWNVQ